MKLIYFLICIFQLGVTQPVAYSVPVPTADLNTTHNSTLVLICKSSKAYAYHTHYCAGLKRCTHQVEKIEKTEAEKLNYTPCKKCYGGK